MGRTHLNSKGQHTIMSKLELQGKKWICENFTDKKDIVIKAEQGQSVYIYNCKGSVIQIQGKAPSFAVDKSAGVTLFLTKDDTESSIFTSLASDVNINVLAENEDPKETNVPSQFVTTFEDGKWVTKPVEHV